MGTRNLTIVYLEGEYKIAQYGQWDGYPECGGVEVLKFAKKLQDPSFRSEFEKKVKRCFYLTESEIEHIFDTHEKDWDIIYPQLNRDMGRGVLDFVANCESPKIPMEDSIDFAAYSLFCEWAWVVDLDANKLEAYRGFNDHTQLKRGDRFFYLSVKARDGYYPVIKAGEWSIDNLPEERDFIDFFSHHIDIVELCGVKALFADYRIRDDLLPNFAHKYEIRGINGDLATLENRVTVDFEGTIITIEPIEIPECGFIDLSDLNEEKSLNFTGLDTTVSNFLYI